MTSLAEQIRDTPRRRVPSLPHWWMFAGGIAMIALLLVVVVSGLTGDDTPVPAVPAVPSAPEEAVTVIIPTTDGEFFGLPEEAVTLGQNAVRGVITGDWSGVTLPPGAEYPVSWAQDLPALTVANPAGGRVLESGRSYRLAFPVDPDGAVGPIESDIFEVTVLFTPATGWVWLPDEQPADGG